jgi:hypothetical protein
VQTKGTKIVTALSIGVGIAVILFVLTFYPSRSVTAVKISFGYTTNDPALGRVAIINVINESAEDIECILCPPQTRKYGVWSKLIYPKTGNISTLSLSAHEAGTFFSPVATNCASWQVPVLWHYTRISKLEYFRSCIKGNVYWNYERLMNGQGLYFFNSSINWSHNSFSEVITNK